jgi:hypothetical protein
VTLAGISGPTTEQLLEEAEAMAAEPIADEDPGKRSNVYIDDTAELEFIGMEGDDLQCVSTQGSGQRSVV